MDRLTIFIGENDSGKTAILDALALLLTNRNIVSSDLRLMPDGKPVAKCMVKGVFELEADDGLPEDFRTPNGAHLILTKVFSVSGVRCTVQGRGFADARWDTFAKQTAGVQREMLQGIGVAPASNADQRVAQFQEALSSGTLIKEPTEFEVSVAQVLQYLPRFELVASTEYRYPDTMVQRTLQSVVDSFLRPEDPVTHERVPLPEVTKLRDGTKTALDAKISEMEESLRRVHPKLVSITASPNVDLAKSLTAVSLVVDVGDGPKPLASFGEGTKKKLWMGLLEWERETQKSLTGVSVIRAYDEPDVNLDY